MAKLFAILSFFIVISFSKADVTTYFSKTHLLPNSRDTAVHSLIDSIIDLALKKIKTEIVEPLVLQDEVMQLNKSILFIPIKGEMALYNGKLSGLDTIRRVNNANFSFHNLHDVNVNCSFRFEKVNFTYDFQSILYNKISTNGVVRGNIVQLVADAIMDINLKTKTIEMTSLNLTKVKSLNLKVESSKYLDKFVNFVLKLVTSNFKMTILSQIEKELRIFFKQKIPFHY